MVHAISGENGEVVFSGKDAGEVINHAIGSIPINKGGEIRIKVGRYLENNLYRC